MWPGGVRYFSFRRRWPAGRRGRFLGYSPSPPPPHDAGRVPVVALVTDAPADLEGSQLALAVDGEVEPEPLRGPGPHPRGEVRAAAEEDGPRTHLAHVRHPLAGELEIGGEKRDADHVWLEATELIRHGVGRFVEGVEDANVEAVPEKGRGDVEDAERHHRVGGDLWGADIDQEDLHLRKTFIVPRPRGG